MSQYSDEDYTLTETQCEERCDELRSQLDEANKIIESLGQESDHFCKQADKLRIQVARLEGELAEAQWRPIETVPKNGDEIILVWTGTRVLPIGIGLLKTATDESTPEHLRLMPTYWRPLPDPPRSAPETDAASSRDDV